MFGSEWYCKEKLDAGHLGVQWLKLLLSLSLSLSLSLEKKKVIHLFEHKFIHIQQNKFH